MASIYRFFVYDGRFDGLIQSSRWGTREGIARIGGLIQEHTEVTTFEAAVGTELPGLTVRDFDPTAKFRQKT